MIIVSVEFFQSANCQKIEKNLNNISRLLKYDCITLVYNFSSIKVIIRKDTSPSFCYQEEICAVIWIFKPCHLLECIGNLSTLILCSVVLFHVLIEIACKRQSLQQ